MTLLARIQSEVLNTPLLCTPEYAETFISFLGDRVGVDNSNMSMGEFETRDQSSVGTSSVGVIPIIGSLSHRPVNAPSSSERSYRAISAELDALMADDQISTILLEIDSPGGAVSGAFDLADKISEASNKKRIIAFVDGQASSAAYLLASGASRIYMTQTSKVGSIGVVMAHVDQSKAMDKAGIKPTFIFAGAHKVDGNSATPLPKAVKERLQADIDDVYGRFISHVAKNRLRMNEKSVGATEALTFSPKEAIDWGLADKVMTLEQTMSEIQNLSPIEEGGVMPQEKTFSQADLDKAVAEAAANAKSSATSEAMEKGATAERSRISKIMGSEHFKGREAMGQLLIDKGTASDEAIELLAVAPVATPVANNGKPEAGGEANGGKPEAGAAQKAALEELANSNPDVGPDASAAARGQVMSEENKSAEDSVAAAKSLFASRGGR